jgi:hypothetical protein
MKKQSNSKTSVTNSNKQLNKTTSTLENESTNKSANKNIMRTIRILNKKGYEAKLGVVYRLISLKPVPAIFFGDMLSPISFHDYPIGFMAVRMEKKFYLQPNCLMKPDEVGQLGFMESTILLVKWAEKLPEAVDLNFVIVVPEGLEPLEIADDIQWDFCLRRFHIYQLREGKDYRKRIMFFMKVAPNAVKQTVLKLKESVKGKGIRLTC